MDGIHKFDLPDGAQPASRSYDRWTWHQDYLPLWASIGRFEGPQIADVVGRTPRAVQSRLRKLIRFQLPSTPPSLLRGPKVLDTFTEITEGWETADFRHLVEGYHRREGLFLWDEMHDVVLRQAWDAGEPTLGALSTRIGVDETAVADRLRRIGIVASRDDVIDRLGATPDGDFYVNALLAREKSAATIWVLCVSVGDGRTPRVTTHPTLDDAQSALAALRAEAGSGSNSLSWMISENLVGESFARCVLVGDAATGSPTIVAGSAPEKRRSRLRWRFRSGPPLTRG